MPIAFGTPSTGGGVFAPSSTTVQTTLTVSAGSTVLAAVTTARSTGTITCADNVNGAYTQIDTLTDASFTSTTTFFRFTNSASGTLTITGTFPSNNFPIISAVEITGAVTTGIDGHNAAQQTAGAGSALSPGSFSNGTQPALVVGYNINDTGDCATTGAAGYTVATTGAATGSWQWQRVTATGAQAPTWTTSDFGGHMTFGVAIDEATAGGNTMAVSATSPVSTMAASLASTDSLAAAAVSPVSTMAASLATVANVITVAATSPVSTMAAAVVETFVVVGAAVSPVASMAAALFSTDAMAVAGVSPVSSMAASLFVSGAVVLPFNPPPLTVRVTQDVLTVAGLGDSLTVAGPRGDTLSAVEVTT